MDSLTPVTVPSDPRPRGARPRLLAGLAIIVLAGGIGWLVYRWWFTGAKDAQTAGGNDAVLVVTARVIQQDVPFYAEGLGRVHPLNSVLVRSQVDGQIGEIAFQEGQEVHAGDLLVQIDPRTYQAAVAQAEAKRAQDVAQQDSARKILADNTALIAKGAIDQQSYDVQRAVVAQLEALVRADDAAVAAAGLQLEHTRITSPIDGRAGLRLVDRGNLVRASDPAGLVVINQVRPMAVVFTLPERSLPQIAGGLAADPARPPLAALAIDRDNQAVLDAGELAAVDNQIDETSGTIRCKAVFPNRSLGLWPGQFVNVRLLTATRKEALTVPASAVQPGPDGYFVFALRADQTVEVRLLKVAQIENGIAVIDRGLTV
ncbi:MAG: putative Co/Zn/Cd efflux system rane fusion protein, partial [Lacunisphaera sp.]|nr:putative Co/Zn/Cd efflux system rane fusion protein [Lacunisphaera sp.]